MKRMLPALLAAVLLLGACSLFGGGEEPPPEDVSADPDEPVLTKKEITLTVLPDGESDEEFLRSAAAAFNQKYPNIKFSIEKPFSAASSAAKPVSDLSTVPHTDIRMLAESLTILPSRDQTKTKNAVFPACAQAATVNGVIYGYPVSSETVALFYNKRLVGEDEVPSTWDELEAFAGSFEGGRQAAFALPVGSVYHNAPFLAVWNNRPFGQSGENADMLYLSSSAAIEGMTLFQRLKGMVGLPSEELSADAVEMMFISGRVAMCIAGSWSAARFAGAGIDFGAAPLPSFGEEGLFPSMAFARVMTVSAYSEWPDEASAFAAFLLTEEMQALRAELTGELPSVETPLRLPAYAGGFIRQMPAAFAAPTIPYAAEYWEAFSQAAVRIWDGGNVAAELAAAEGSLRAPPPVNDEE